MGKCLILFLFLFSWAGPHAATTSTSMSPAMEKDIAQKVKKGESLILGYVNLSHLPKTGLVIEGIECLMSSEGVKVRGTVWGGFTFTYDNPTTFKLDDPAKVIHQISESPLEEYQVQYQQQWQNQRQSLEGEEGLEYSFIVDAAGNRFPLRDREGHLPTNPMAEFLLYSLIHRCAVGYLQ